MQWLLSNLEVRDTTEGLLLANRMAACGYFFPIDDHVLAVKNDNTYYRFQVRKEMKKKRNTKKIYPRFIHPVQKIRHCVSRS